MPESSHKNISWSRVLENAARLWAILDKADNGNRVTPVQYAFDSNIPVLFFAPHRNEVKPELLGILDDETLIDLSFLLGALSLSESRGNGVLLFGHDVEFQTIYNAVVRNSENNTSYSLDALMERNASGMNQAGQKDFLKIRLVRDTFKQSGAALTLLRGFIRKAKLRTATTAAESGDLPFIDSHSEKFLLLSEKWFVELKERKRSGRTHQVMADAHAMAHLFLINEKTRELDGREVHLLTVDEQLQEVAFETNLPGSEYIRDPRMFLSQFKVNISSDESSIGFGRNDQYGIRDWLRLLLSPFSRGGHMDNRAIVAALRWLRDERMQPRQRDALTQNMLRDLHGERAETLAEEWHDYIRLSINASARTVLGEYESFAKLGDAILGGRSGDVDSVIREMQIRELGDLSTTALVTSLYSGIREAQSIGLTFKSRMPMAIRYSSDQERLLFLTELRRAIAEKRIDLIEQREGLGDQYNIHLVSCQLHASGGDWGAAEATARMAILLAQLSENNVQIFGHEAFYAHAVCLRHRLDEPNQVPLILQRVKSAEETYAMHFEGALDGRFEVERISLEVMLRYFAQYFPDKWSEVDGPLREFSEGEILEKLRLLLRKTAEVLAESESESIVQLSLTKQIAMNAISLVCLGAIRTNTSLREHSKKLDLIEFAESLKSVHDRISGDLDREHLISSNYFDFIRALANYVVYPADDERLVSIRNRVFNISKDVSLASEFPYETAKTQDIVRLL